MQSVRLQGLRAVSLAVTLTLQAHKWLNNGMLLQIIGPPGPAG